MDKALLEPYQKLIKIVVLGRVLEVPENNLLLRQMQYVAEEIGYGKYCWNAECRYCEVTYTKDEGPEQPALACRIKGLPEMMITKVAPEIKYNMRAALATAPKLAR